MEVQDIRDFIPNRYGTAEERFWSRVHFEAGPLETECLIWDGYTDAAGYGQFERTSPHRWAFKKYVGPIPGDKEIDHLCRRRNCANWMHAEVVTHRVNMERSRPDVTLFSGETPSALVEHLVEAVQSPKASSKENHS